MRHWVVHSRLIDKFGGLEVRLDSGGRTWIATKSVTLGTSKIQNRSVHSAHIRTMQMQV